MRFHGKVAIVTGGSSGMGNATVRLLAEEGARVYVLDLQPTEDGCRFLPCNVADSRRVKECVDEVVNQEGRIDLLFAAAGIHLFADIEGTSLEDFERVLSVNLKGTFYVLKAVLPIMRRQSGGAVVLMGSDQVFVGKGSSSAYGLTKAAIGQLTKSTAIDYAAHNVRVNCICPGTIQTPMLEPTIQKYHAATGIPLDTIHQQLRDAQPIKRLGTAEEIARAVAFLLSDEACFMTGALLSVDGGYVAQ